MEFTFFLAPTSLMWQIHNTIWIADFSLLFLFNWMNNRHFLYDKIYCPKKLSNTRKSSARIGGPFSTASNDRVSLMIRTNALDRWLASATLFLGFSVFPEFRVFLGFPVFPEFTEFITFPVSAKIWKSLLEIKQKKK